MPRLLRVHFASIGHPDARLAPLTLDLRALDGDGSGVDTVLWLRNGGGKSTILNLFYSVFRPERREFLGTSAEGRARHLEHYVKADDLAFVVTEWDVDPPADAALFARPPARRRVVGQVLAWRDRQLSTDASRLRRRFFTLFTDRETDFDDLPIEGLGPRPVRSYEAFREWLDGVRQARPELEAQWEESPKQWGGLLERAGLDPELFRYQLKMNQREGSADEAFRFRSVDEFVRFYLDVAFDPSEADKVSAIVEQHRDQLARRPGFVAERAFLEAARAEIGPLREAVAASRAAHHARTAARAAAGALSAALRIRGDQARATAAEAEAEAARSRAAAVAASNDADRLNRWANGLDRRATELDLTEAAAAKDGADAAHAAATEAVRAADGAIARDHRKQIEADRDAKAQALRLAVEEREPLRVATARAGATVRAALAEAATRQKADADAARTRRDAAAAARSAAEARLHALTAEDAKLGAEVVAIDRWLGDRDRAREKLRADDTLALREDADDALRRWDAARADADAEAARQTALRDAARATAEAAAAEASRQGALAAGLIAEVRSHEATLARAHAEHARLQALAAVRDVEATDTADLDAPGLGDRLRTLADRHHRAVLDAAVDGAEDDRSATALEKTGRLPAAADVERVVESLRDGGLSAFHGTRYLVDNVADPATREQLVRADPARWHGVVVLDADGLARAAGTLATARPRGPVTVALPSLVAAATADRVVLPGHPAHWDARAGSVLRDELSERRTRRERERERDQAAERAAREAASALATWRKDWGDGRLASAVADQAQRVAKKNRAESEQTAATAAASAAKVAEREADVAAKQAAAAATGAAARAVRVRDLIDTYEALVEPKRVERARAEARRIGILDERAAQDAARARHEQAFLAARDDAKAADTEAAALLAERDRVDLTDDAPPEAVDLVVARATWASLRAQWDRVVSENKLQWELDQLEGQLRAARATERARNAGREAAVAAIVDGAVARALAEPAEKASNEAAIAARLVHAAAQKAVNALSRRRDADDLPADEPPPANAAAARARAERCRADSAAARQRTGEENTATTRWEHAQGAAAAEADRCHQRDKRLSDAVPELPVAAATPLPDVDGAVDTIVDATVKAARDADTEVSKATKRSEDHAERLRQVALAAAHEAHRSRVKERLKAPAAELAEAADALGDDVDARLDVVRATLDDIDKDRQLVLGELDKIAMEGVELLRAAERASRLPTGLGAWENQPFLKIHADVPPTQSDRRGRLEPLLDRLVDKGEIPHGHALVFVAVQAVAPRIEATLLKPDAHLRRERLDVTDMQTFSRGQQLTVAILLYCTLARLRATRRGRRADGGVLLLDNPVGTCSSVPLLDLQRTVARQMGVQLVYTTGVNDVDAVATFPNTVRLRNAHRDKATGELHVTVEGLEALRIVAT